ncbi:MAG: DUF1104 domain-containing protein [Desulfobulbaceae bacterium]|nr:DUF1104 domain-containing protein [Desulfobulbaceae bacterium]
MNHMLQIIGFCFLLLTVVSSAGWSMDFVNVSNEELFELRGAIQNAPEADQEVYRTEWEKRVAGLTMKKRNNVRNLPKQ